MFSSRIIRRRLTHSSSLLSRRRRRWNSTTKPIVHHHLDLTGLSILERLVLEEYLYQTQTQTNWLLIGTHGLNSELDVTSPWSLSSSSSLDLASSSSSPHNNNAAIVLGIGGKIPELLYTEHVQQDCIPVIRRFSGGGTVLMNPDCIWTTIIGRDFPVPAPFYPRPLMEYTATHLFQPLFARLQHYQQCTRRIQVCAGPDCTRRGAPRLERLIQDVLEEEEDLSSILVERCECQNECGNGPNILVNNKLVMNVRGREAILQALRQQQQPNNNNNNNNNLFALREHDYVWNKDSKIAGNAQSIGKTGWLHHTSFLWHIPVGMSRYLRLPTKRPAYRAERPHEQFVQALAEVFPELSVHDFRAAFQETCQAVYHVESSSSCGLSQLDAVLVPPPSGGLEQWHRTHSRTKVITQF